MDAVASEISLVERSRRCAIHIFTQTRFLEVTSINISHAALKFPGCGTMPGFRMRLRFYAFLEKMLAFLREL